MALQFATVGSGSKGNACLVKSRESLILVDCGFAVRELGRRLEILDVSLEDISAVLVTHEHSDHCKGVGALARQLKLPVYMTPGTQLGRDFGRIPNMNLIVGYSQFAVGDITVSPVAVPHDAREPAQFIFESGGRKLGVLTDLGSITPHILAAYSHCDGLLLEANHDSQLLAQGPYPWSLKQRVAGDWGHLNNSQAVEFLEMASMPTLSTLVVGHISEKNNCLSVVREAFASTSFQKNIHFAAQGHPSEWFELGV